MKPQKILKLLFPTYSCFIGQDRTQLIGGGWPARASPDDGRPHATGPAGATNDRDMPEAGRGIIVRHEESLRKVSSLGT